MARVQTRRAVSFNKDVFAALDRYARRANKTVSQYVTDKLREAGVKLPKVTHAPVAYVEAMKARRFPSGHNSTRNSPTYDLPGKRKPISQWRLPKIGGGGK